MQRGPREGEARFLQFTIQGPGDLIYFPHFFAHAVLTLYSSSATVSSSWNVATTLNQLVVFQTLNEYTFTVRRGK